MSTVETKTVELPNTPELTAQAVGDTQIRSLIYSTTKFPLDDFFTRVRHGEFSTAFKKIDLNYKASNTNNRALEHLIDSGFVPVYIEIQNNGTTAINIRETDFILDNGQNQIRGIAATELPSKFKSLNPSAFAANTANLGMVIIGTAALLVAFGLLIGSCHGSCDFSSSGGSHSLSRSNASSKSEDSSIFNDLHKTTVINYRSYLLHPAHLEPGESTMGLLFFSVNPPIGIQDYKLRMTPSESLTR